MSARFKRYLKVFLFTVLGLVILWLITRNQDLGRIWDELKQARFKWLFLAVLSGFLSHLARAARWNLLIRPLGKTPSLSTTFYALMTGYLANFAIPRLGEITRCATLARYSSHPFNALAGTVVAERVFDMLCTMLLIFLTLLFQFSLVRGFLSTYIVFPLYGFLQNNIILFVFASLFLLVAAFVLLAYIKNTSSKKDSRAAKFKKQLLGFWQGILSLKHIRSKFRFFGLSVIIWLFYFFTVYFAFFALPGTSSLGVSAGFTVLTMGTLGVVAPVPGGVGTYHFIVITTLTELWGVGMESATSYAYIAHAAQMVMVIALGALSWVVLSYRMVPDKAPDKD